MNMEVYSEAGEFRYAAINASPNTSAVLVTAFNTTRVRCVGYAFMVSAAAKISFKSGGTVIAGPFPCGVNGGVAGPFHPSGHFQTTFAKSLRILSTVNTPVGGHLVYQLIRKLPLKGDA